MFLYTNENLQVFKSIFNEIKQFFASPEKFSKIELDQFCAKASIYGKYLANHGNIKVI